nr:MAG TPA: hypothetical protein [Caudoviricetes sp.]
MEYCSPLCYTFCDFVSAHCHAVPVERGGDGGAGSVDGGR